MICLLPSAAMFITVMFGGKQCPIPEHRDHTQGLASLYPRDLGRRDTDWEGDGELRKPFSRDGARVWGRLQSWSPARYTARDGWMKSLQCEHLPGVLGLKLSLSPVILVQPRLWAWEYKFS